MYLLILYSIALVVFLIYAECRFKLVGRIITVVACLSIAVYATYIGGHIISGYESRFNRESLLLCEQALTNGDTQLVIMVLHKYNAIAANISTYQASLEMSEIMEASKHQFQQIHVGMSRDEVYQLLGKPQGIDVKGVKDVTTEMWVTPSDIHGTRVQLSIFFGADGRAQKVEQFLNDFYHTTNPWPNKSPEPTAVGAGRSAIAVHVASRRWLSFFR
jgi:hypothetical protein